MSSKRDKTTNTPRPDRRENAAQAEPGFTVMLTNQGNGQDAKILFN
jgi:hypothetical protein